MVRTSNKSNRILDLWAAILLESQDASKTAVAQRSCAAAGALELPWEGLRNAVDSAALFFAETARDGGSIAKEIRAVKTVLGDEIARRFSPHFVAPANGR